MKKFCLTIAIAVLCMIISNEVQAQTTQTKLNQVELMKQFAGTWKSETNDTTNIIEDKSYGDGHDVYIKTETKGKIIWEQKSLIGYDKKNDILIEAIIKHSSPNIMLCSIRFIASNKFEEILLEDISTPENVTEKWINELKSPDLLILTIVKNDKVVSVNTFKRVK
ncbi:MAG: hypothetical protein NTY95_18450 [Bacteroidia bacterium]|nr:hypothetical protein [Bacteroidia bacterium]